MSIIDELTACIDTAPWCYEDGIGSRHILHIPYEELAAIAKRIRKANNDAVNKAHADGERNAVKQLKGKTNGEDMDSIRTESESIRFGGKYQQGTEGTSRFEQGSSITDELREYAFGWDERNRVRRDLTAIADCIDERHECEVGAADVNGYHRALEEVADGYVKLPLDADGVPIHVGDAVNEFEVRHLVLIDKDTWEVEDRFGEPFNPSTLHRTVPDSWESIIGDAMGAFLSDDSPAEPTMEELVERCRRLAGE